jgi:hypothetical protein
MKIQQITYRQKPDDHPAPAEGLIAPMLKNAFDMGFAAGREEERRRRAPVLFSLVQLLKGLVSFR